MTAQVSSTSARPRTPIPRARSSAAALLAGDVRCECDCFVDVQHLPPLPRAGELRIVERGAGLLEDLLVLFHGPTRGFG